MRKLLFLFFLIFISSNLLSQEMQITNFDPCYEDISDKLKKKFSKAFELFEKRDYHNSSLLLRELIKDEENFASAHFLISIIGSYKQNQTIVEKYTLLTQEACSDFHHPLYFYFKGVIDYSNENYSSATVNFNKFFENYTERGIITDSIFNDCENYLEWSKFLDRIQKEKIPFNPYKITELSTKDNEYLPSITMDGNRLYYNRRMDVRIDASESFFQQNNTEKRDLLCYSDKMDNGKFSNYTILDEPFNFNSIQSSPSLRADNKVIFFSQCEIKGGEFDCDIYYSKYLDGYWSNAISLGGDVNRSDSRELQPCVSPNGRVLYFVSNRPGGRGGYDIWIAYKQENGSWGRVQNAGVRINTEFDEKSPFLHPDGVSFYFSSNGWKGVGGFDNFYLRLDKKEMKTPINMGTPMNTDRDEEGFVVDLNNRGYFASNLMNEDGNWDIYTFDLYNDFHSLPTIIANGRVILIDDDYKNVSLELISLKDKKKIIYEVDERNGEFSLALKKDEPYIIKAKSEGYAFESRLINKFNAKDEIILEMSPLVIGEGYIINDILFETNSYELSQESKDIIMEFVEYLNQYPRIRCTIEGHTDNIGNEEENLILSEKRAKAVADFIINSRIREDRIKYKGYGSKQPIQDNSTPEKRALNRRTVFKIDAL